MTQIDLPQLKTRAFGHPTYHQPEVDSTQDLLKKLVDEGAKEGTTILADHQSAGRGRQKRNWVSLPGPQVFCSILLQPTLPLHRWPILNIVAGLALRRTLESLGISNAQIKWPNDVYLNGRKVAGILSELHMDKAKNRNVLLLGVGINVSGKKTDFPEELQERATTVEAMFKPIDRLDLLARFLETFEEDVSNLAHKGSNKICEDFARYWIFGNQEISVVSDGSRLQGTAEGIDEDGALLFYHQGKVTRILSGDIIRT